MSVETFVRFQTPSQMAPEALEAIFVQREDLARRLVDKIAESATTKSKHHALLIGPRGIGKTHLVSLVHNRALAREELQGKLAIAWLREEAYSVASYVHLLLAVLKAVAQPARDFDLDEVIDHLQAKDELEQQQFAEEALLRAVGDRTLLVITENLDDTFDAIEGDGQHKLRALVQNHPCFTILATSQSLFGGVSVRESPFYGFFEVNRLDRFSFEEALAMLIKIAELRGDNDLRDRLRTPLGRARVRAIDHLAAGSPRIYVILSEFLGAESIDELVEPVLKMIENLTPYYQSRMQLITPQQRAIVEYLCEHEEASPVKTIARGVLITQQTASSQLKKLKDLGYVRSVKSGREAHYELQEPLMRMALSAKTLRGKPLRLFVEFLRRWFTEGELATRLEGITSSGGLDAEYAAVALKLCRDSGKDPRFEASLRDYKLFAAASDYGRALAAAEELVELKGGASEWRAKGAAEIGSKNCEDAVASCDKALEIDRRDLGAWLIRGAALNNLKRYEDAVASFDKALEIDPRSSGVWALRGSALLHLERYEDVVASFDKALDIDHNHAWPWAIRGEALSNLERYEDAVASFDKALEIDPRDGSAWAQRGVALSGLERHEDAVASFDKALKINPQYAEVWVLRGADLRDLERHEDAVASCDKALEIDPRSSGAWVLRGSALLHLERYEDVVASFDKVLEINPQYAGVWELRGFALRNLGRQEDALDSLDKAVELDSEDVARRILTAQFRIELGRTKEAAEIVASLVSSDLSTEASTQLIQFVDELASDRYTVDARLEWVRIWKEAAGHREDYRVALRMLEQAVLYLNTGDRAALLALPAEERSIIAPLVGWTESDDDGQ